MAKNIAPHLPGGGLFEGREPLLGMPSPDWQMKDEQGDVVTLKRLIRQRPILLHLYRGAW